MMCLVALSGSLFHWYDHSVFIISRGIRDRHCSYTDLGQALFVVNHIALQHTRDERIYTVSQMLLMRQRQANQWCAQLSASRAFIWCRRKGLRGGDLHRNHTLCHILRYDWIRNKQILPYIVASKALAGKLVGITEIVCQWMVWAAQQNSARRTTVTHT